MRLLVIGGGWFVGRALVDAAVALGWHVTTFSRTGSGNRPGVEAVHGDRTSTDDLVHLATRGEWDAVVDVPGVVPAQVRDSVRALAGHAERYVLVSSVSAYRDWPAVPVTDKPVWLWWSGVHATDATSPADVDRLWQAFLRRFDIEHTFRMWKQTLGWTCPKTRTPQAADRWTWLILAVYTQLRLTRPLAADLRRPWEKPVTPQRLSPARVRRGFRHLRTRTECPAAAPKPSRPGPGRPPGRRNTNPAPRHDVHIATAATSAKTTKKKAKKTQPRPRHIG